MGIVIHRGGVERHAILPAQTQNATRMRIDAQELVAQRLFRPRRPPWSQVCGNCLPDRLIQATLAAMVDFPTHNPDMAERWRRSQDDVARLRADNDKMSDAAKVDEGAAPSRCPACRSQDVKTTSKVASVDAYWRCGACGEVWNVARHRAGSRYARNLPPFRR
jgi:hypothetical protein